MDIYKAIHDLMQEKKRLDAVIASLESRTNGRSREKSRRGRKSMNAEERAAVSRRMAAYWAARRGQASAAPEQRAAIASPQLLARVAGGLEASMS